MQYCRGGKIPERFSSESDFTEQIFTGELSGVYSAAVLRHNALNLVIKLIPNITKYYQKTHPISNEERIQSKQYLLLFEEINPQR